MENTNNRIFQHLRILGQGLPEVVLAEGEEVRVSDTPDVGGPPVAHLAAGDVHDAQLAEHDALAQRHEHLDPVRRHHVQLPLLDDVHLLAHVALPAHVVPGREDLQLQLEHQGLQEAALTILTLSIVNCQPSVLKLILL